MPYPTSLIWGKLIPTLTGRMKALLSPGLWLVVKIFCRPRPILWFGQRVSLQVLHLRHPLQVLHLRYSFQVLHLRPPLQVLHLRYSFQVLHLRPPLQGLHLRHLREPLMNTVVILAPMPLTATLTQSLTLHLKVIRLLHKS